MAKNNYWILLVFASEAYTVVLPIILLACSMIFGFHAILNTPAFNDRMQARATANLFGIIELLNCICFVVLLANLFFAFREKNAVMILSRAFFFGLSGVITILVYPATVLVPTF